MVWIAILAFVGASACALALFFRQRRASSGNERVSVTFSCDPHLAAGLMASASSHGVDLADFIVERLERLQPISVDAARAFERSAVNEYVDIIRPGHLPIVFRPTRALFATLFMAARITGETLSVYVTRRLCAEQIEIVGDFVPAPREKA